ncbi:MAG: glycosyltransferase family 87 protein [Promethearchaeota archaeon]
MRRWMSWAFLISCVVIHVMFISSLFTGSLNSFFYDTKFIVGQGADFFSYYQAGHNVLNGLSPYAIPESLSVPYLYPFRYLAYFAYTFGVMVNLAQPIPAYWIWIGILICSIWLAVIRTRYVAKALRRPQWEGNLAMGMWFAFSPIYIELYVGQVTLIAGILTFFALTTSSFVDGLKSRWGTLTAAWTTGSLTKLIPYFIAPVLIGAGKVRTVLVAIFVTILAILAVPAGFESLQYFLNFNTARTFYINPYPGSHSLKMLLLYLLGQPTSDFTGITVILMVIFLALSLSTTLYSRDVWSCAGLFSLTYFFIMTDVWEHHYTFLLPFLVLAWIRGGPEDKARWIPFTLVLLMSLPVMPMIEFLGGYGPGLNPINWDLAWKIVYHSSKVIPSIIFFVWLLITASRSPRADSFVEMVSDIFQISWAGLVAHSAPKIEGGIIVKQGVEKKDDSN